jgi:hypothetical protein
VQVLVLPSLGYLSACMTGHRLHDRIGGGLALERKVRIPESFDGHMVEKRGEPLPPILFPGAKESQKVKCLAVGHFRMSSPHSPTRRRTM